MLIYLGADHGGFLLKETIKKKLIEQGYEVQDYSQQYQDGDDYPDVAALVAQSVSRAPDVSRGIVLCTSGVGVDVVSNKFKNVRCGFAYVPDQVHSARHDDDINILAIAAGFTPEDAAINFVRIFLETPFSRDERYARRLEKIHTIESNL